MRKLILSISLIIAASVGFTHAQNVFKNHGFDKKPLTFTDGRYNEFLITPKWFRLELCYSTHELTK